MAKKKGFSFMFMVAATAVVATGGGLGVMLLTGMLGSDKDNSGTENGGQVAPVEQPLIMEVDKDDPKWLIKYCKDEVIKLPEAPFQYQGKEGPSVSMANPYIKKLIPEDKRYQEESCTMTYNYNNEEAFNSVGIEYEVNIKSSNKFKEKVDLIFSDKINSSWKKISPLSSEESGQPSYSYQGFPLVFTRENPYIGTIEYVEAFFGASRLYIKISIYEE